MELDEVINDEEEGKSVPQSTSVRLNLPPSCQNYIIDDLDEMSSYNITLMTVSDRYFENSDLEPNEKNEIPLHLDFADLHSDWLPAVTIQVGIDFKPFEPVFWGKWYKLTVCVLLLT